MATSVEPISQADWDALPGPKQGTGTGADTGTAGISQEQWDALPGPNVDANDSVLSQLGQREWALGRTVAHGALSIPAGIAGLPALTGKVLNKVPDWVPGAGAAHDLGAVASGVGQALEPTRGFLQQTADAIAPAAQPNELGLANHPTLGKVISGTADVVGGIAGGNVLGQLSGLATESAPAQRIISAVTKGSDAPLSARAAAVLSRQLSGVDLAAAKAPGGMLADAAAPTAGAVHSAAGVAGQADMSGALLARAKGQPAEIAQLLEAGTGAKPGSLMMTQQQLADAQQAAGAPLFDAARADQPLAYADLQQWLDRPAFRDAWAKVQRSAANAGTPIPDLPEPGSNPLAGVKITSGGKQISLADDPKMQQVLEMNPQFQASQAAAAGPPIDFTTFQNLKRGLRGLAQKGYEGGAPFTADDAASVNQAVKEMTAHAYGLRDSWQQANSSWADFASLKDAHQQGYDMFAGGASSPSADAVTAAMGDLSPPERVQFVSGAVSRVADAVANASGSATGKADLVSRIYSSLGGQSKLATLAQNPEGAELIDKGLQRIGSQWETGSKIMGGSATQPRQVAAAQLAADVRAATEPVTPLGRGIAAVASPRAAMVKAADFMGARGLRQTAGELAPAMVAQGPDLYPILAQLNRAAKVTGAAKSGLPRLGGTIGGLDAASQQ